MHLIQYGASDHIYENGIETGFCRMYNTPDSEKKIPVDSLYFSWLLEAGAELGMADYLEVEPYTYQKKRSYATSYNLSRFYEKGMEENALENVVFKYTLEEGFADLGLESEEEKKAFLDFVYSIEITQTDEDDFWEYYESQTGKMQVLYDEYYLQLKSENDEVRDNCNLSGMNDYMKDYILSARRGYATANYSRIHDVAKEEANERFAGREK